MTDYIFNYDQYKKTINKKNGFNFSVMFIVIILLLGLCVFLYPKQTNTLNFYFVEIDNFQTYNKANSLANEIKNSGGAGYVYFDGTYHVLASFYSNYKSAEKVVNNLKSDYKNATVFNIETYKFTDKKKLNSSQNKSIKNFLDTTHTMILNLEKLNTNFDKKSLQIEELKIHIKNNQEEFNNVYSSLIEDLKNNSKFNFIKEYLVQMKNSLSNLSNLENNTASSTLRYETVKLVINRIQFLSCF